MLNEDLKNALIPFEQVKITGDLGKGREWHLLLFLPCSTTTLQENLTTSFHFLHRSFWNGFQRCTNKTKRRQ